MLTTSQIEEDNLSLTARAVMNERLTYLSAAKMKRLEAAVCDILKREVPGDILEFGVALGGSAIVLAKHAARCDRRFLGFDVFGMIPEPSSDKDDHKSKARYKVIASGKSAGIGGDLYYGYRKNLFHDVCTSFKRHGMQVDGIRVALHKGLFEETWPPHDVARVALAHLDCDWYDPVKFCLNALAENLAPGGAIVLDDYNDYGGCRTAVDEFLASRSDFSIQSGPNAILWRKETHKP
jgi:O-methyltransferase